MRINVRVWLACLSGHLNRHPHLEHTITSIYGYQRGLLVGHSQFEGTLQVLAAWARSLTGVSPVGITSVGDERTHLRVRGLLADKSEIAITAILDEHDSDLLAVNTRVVKGETFPADLLLRLTRAADAEAVAR